MTVNFSLQLNPVLIQITLATSGVKESLVGCVNMVSDGGSQDGPSNLVLIQP